MKRFIYTLASLGVIATHYSAAHAVEPDTLDTGELRPIAAPHQTFKDQCVTLLNSLSHCATLSPEEQLVYIASRQDEFKEYHNQFEKRYDNLRAIQVRVKKNPLTTTSTYEIYLMEKESERLSFKSRRFSTMYKDFYKEQTLNHSTLQLHINPYAYENVVDEIYSRVHHMIGLANASRQFADKYNMHYNEVLLPLKIKKNMEEENNLYNSPLVHAYRAMVDAHIGFKNLLYIADELSRRKLPKPTSFQVSLSGLELGYSSGLLCFDCRRDYTNETYQRATPCRVSRVLSGLPWLDPRRDYTDETYQRAIPSMISRVRELLSNLIQNIDSCDAIADQYGLPAPGQQVDQAQPGPLPADLT